MQVKKAEHTTQPMDSHYYQYKSGEEKLPNNPHLKSECQQSRASRITPSGGLVLKQV